MTDPAPSPSAPARPTLPGWARRRPTWQTSVAVASVKATMVTVEVPDEDGGRA